MPWYTDLKASPARWIWHAGEKTRHDVALFHATLTPPANTAIVELHVSADNRYTLWAIPPGAAGPGLPLGRGPARGDVQHTSLDVYELETGSPLQVYAQVRWMPGQPEAPMGEVHTSQPGFLLVAIFRDDAGRVISTAGTDDTWRAAKCTGLGLAPMPHDLSYLCVGMLEEHRASGWPADWLSLAGVTSGAWGPAAAGPAPYFKTDPDSPWASGDRPWLIRREVAHPEQVDLAPFTVRDRYAPPDAGTVVDAVFPLALAPNERRRVLLDMGQMVLAYPSVRLAGRGTAARLQYAEVLAANPSHNPSPKHKSFDPASGLPLLGYADGFTLDTGSPRTLALSHWRSFRFLLLDVTAGPDGGAVETLTLEGTGYPLENTSAFEAVGEHRDLIAKTVDVSWRTLKCCTWETYMDCPYYEQMQYVGDTRIQCLVTYVTTADPTLPVQALRAFDRSRIPEGITQSRAPSTGMQLIPTFSLIYILMIEDYLNWVGDEGLVAELRPGVAPILNWFSQFTDRETGLITMPDYWPFVDWVNGWDKGIPPAAPGRDGRGVSALVNLHLLLALDSASRIYERAKPGSGNLYFSRANVLREKIYDHFYHPPTGLIADIPVDDHGNARSSPVLGNRAVPLSFSQHAQALAVLGDVLKADAARRALTWATTPDHLAPSTPIENQKSEIENSPAARPPQFRLSPASFYFRFYLAEALAKAGMGDQLWPLLTPFFDALARGSTTWPESFEPCRSECHAWGSWPLYFFHRHVLGVHPPDPADGAVTVAPLRCDPLAQVRGTTATHAGPVSVDVDWTASPPRVTAAGHNTRVRAHHAT